MHTYSQGTVGERIQDLLREKKLTQAELAERAGISKATLSRYITDPDSRIPHDVLLKIAKCFGVSTDFLLGATDVPYRTNYDIEELGLTAAAAAKLYTGELDPHIVSQLLENPYFPQLVEQLRAFVDGTESAALGTYRQTLSITGRLLQKQGKMNPRDKAATKLALKDLRSHIVSPMLPDMVMIRAAFEALLTDLMRQADARVKEQTKLTSDIMENMIRHLEKRQNTFDLKQITIDDLTDAIVETVEEAGYPADQRENLRKKLTEMFRNCAGYPAKAAYAT